jgi:hypothetical protein
MRLLNTETLALEDFVAEIKPEYAILSHTWGPEEILFEDARYGKNRLLKCGKKALDKVLKSAKLASRHGFKYIWIDTCCIDKKSSAELSEAINSMFAWYRGSAVCYAFLSDYTHHGDHAQDGTLSESRWFTRGWTLQELIAPSEILFLDSAWTPFGDRRSLSSHIANATRIDEALFRRESSCLHHRCHGVVNSQRGCQDCSREAMALTDRSLKSYSISARMSWAARRETTRVEDIAYCLLGIFGVTMPLLYGEGLKAFRRLQEEIVRHSNDQTFLAWDRGLYRQRRLPMDAVFAPHPACFMDGHLFRPIPALLSEFTTTVRDGGGGAVELDVHLARCTTDDQTSGSFAHRSSYLAALNCSSVGDDFGCICILLEQANAASHSFWRLEAVENHDSDITVYGTPRIYPVVVSPTDRGHRGISFIIARYYATRGTIQVQVKFNLSDMTKSRILLQETKDRWTGDGFITPSICFTFPRRLMPGYRLRRQVPDPALPMWDSERTKLPTPYPRYNCYMRYMRPPYIYGAASFSDGVYEFSVIWGSLVDLDMVDADKHYQTPFCKVCRNLDGTPQEADGLTTSDWLLRLETAVIQQDRRDALSAEATAELPGVFSSLAWTSAGSSVCVQATIRGATFLGRKRFEVEIVMKGDTVSP